MCCVRTLLCLLLICSVSLFGPDGAEAAASRQRHRLGLQKISEFCPPIRISSKSWALSEPRSACSAPTAMLQGDFASDDNAKKNIARNMLRIAADINAGFPDDGKRHVTCYTCHRGEAVRNWKHRAPGAAPKPPHRRQ